MYVVREDIVLSIARQFFDSDRSDTQTARGTTRWLLPSNKVVIGLISSTVESKKREVLHAVAIKIEA